MSISFRDRRDAGLRLAGLLHSRGPAPPCVVAVPRGGVPIAYEISRALAAPLDVFVCRRLLLPGRPESALGVLGSRDVRLLDRDLIYGSHIPPEMVDDLIRAGRAALIAEESAYRDSSERPELRGSSIILVDDGTSQLDVLRHSIQLLRELDAAAVTLAAPTMARGMIAALMMVADRIVTVASPELHNPAHWYSDFTPATPGEVRALLSLAQAEARARSLGILA